MVNDVIAAKLEQAGLWRRASARWLDVMIRCSTDAEREWISQRRRYCLSMSSAPRPDNKLDIGVINRAATITQKAMGLSHEKRIELRKYQGRGDKRQY